VLRWLRSIIERRRRAIQSERMRRALMLQEIGGNPFRVRMPVDSSATKEYLKEPDYRAWQSEFEKSSRGHLSRS
jgi:hypothetical protein